MKAIYLNLDPYLAAFAAWIKGGKVGTKPDFQPLPLAVTIPLGEDVVLLAPSDVYGGENIVFTVDGATLIASYSTSTGTTGVGDTDNAISRSFSRFAASNEKYTPCDLTSDSPTLSVVIQDSDGGETIITFAVLVRRETASGPVDLVDFTPPAAVTAASINAALGGTGVAEGTPLAGVLLNGAKWILAGETEPSSIYDTAPGDTTQAANLSMTSAGS